MLYINRLITSEYGWQKSFQDRIEKAAKETNNNNIIFYPERTTVDVIGLNTYAMYANLSLQWLLHNRYRITSKDSFIFLGVFNMPIFQLYYSGLSNNKFFVFTHCDMDMSKYVYFEDIHFITKHINSFPNLITYSKSSSESYSTNVFNVGGFLEKYNNTTSKENLVMWAGSRVDDDMKGYKEFLNIVNNNKDITFVACLDKIIDTNLFSNLIVYYNLTSEEYINLCRKVKYILSTAKGESFGYSLFDAVSVGAIPLVTDIPVHREWIPDKFFYKEVPNFGLDASDEELKQIVDCNYYVNTFNRMMNIVGN
jgi:hypothetical protein